MSDERAQRIGEIEAALRQPLPEIARQLLERELRDLRATDAPDPPTSTYASVEGTAKLSGTVNLGADGRIDGIAVGVNLGKIIYGRDPEEDERKRLVWYLDRLASKLYRLPLRGLDEKLDQGEGVSLPQVYVWSRTP